MRKTRAWYPYNHRIPEISNSCLLWRYSQCSTINISTKKFRRLLNDTSALSNLDKNISQDNSDYERKTL